MPSLLSLLGPRQRLPLRWSSLAPSGFIVTCRGYFLALWPFSLGNLPPRFGFCFGFLISLFFLFEFVFVSFGFCFCYFFYLFRYTLLVMFFGFHSNFLLHLRAPPISSVCSVTYRPLLGFFLHPHCDELSTPPFDFGFRQECDWLLFLAIVIRLACFYIVYFLVILACFSFWFNFCLVFVSL
jgi:hypothetical protein